MLPNPISLPGPEFLLFYVCFSAALLLCFYLLGQWMTGGEQREILPLEDPFEIAFLRGGRNHLLDVALINLIDRGLLQVAGTELKTANKEDIPKMRRPLEKQILEMFLWKANPSTLFSNAIIREKCKAIEHSLRDKGLLPSQSQQTTQWFLFVLGWIILWSLTAVKLDYALARGHHNVLFLIMLSGIVLIPLYKVTRPFRSRAGNLEYARLKERFRGLYDRRILVEQHQPTNEVTLLAAIYGMSALPTVFSEQIKPLRLHEAGSTGVGGGCSGGSSCGGGGGGGGGGCGGGCGGCGG